MDNGRVRSDSRIGISFPLFFASYISYQQIKDAPFLNNKRILTLVCRGEGEGKGEGEGAGAILA